MLRRAIAYYGLLAASDISKQSRTALGQRLGWTNEGPALTSRRGLSGVWTIARLMVTQQTMYLLWLSHGNGLWSYTYQAVVRGTNLGS